VTGNAHTSCGSTDRPRLASGPGSDERGAGRRAAAALVLVITLVAPGSPLGARTCHHNIREPERVLPLTRKRGRLLALAEAAFVAGVPERAIRAAITNGLLAVVIVDGEWHIEAGELQRWQDEQRPQSAENSETAQHSHDEQIKENVGNEKKNLRESDLDDTDTVAAVNASPMSAPLVAPTDAEGRELEFISKQQAADMAGISIRTLDYWHAADPEGLPYHRPRFLRRGKVLINVAEFRTFLLGRDNTAQ
jgi:hypothetical protein